MVAGGAFGMNCGREVDMHNSPHQFGKNCGTRPPVYDVESLSHLDILIK